MAQAISSGNQAKRKMKPCSDFSRTHDLAVCIQLNYQLCPHCCSTMQKYRISLPWWHAAATLIPWTGQQYRMMECVEGP